MAPRQRAKQPAIWKRGLLGISASVALVLTSLGGGAFATTVDPPSDASDADTMVTRTEDVTTSEEVVSSSQALDVKDAQSGAESADIEDQVEEEGAVEVEAPQSGEGTLVAVEPPTVSPMLISPSTTEIRVNARTIATARGTTSNMTSRNCNYNFTTNAWDCTNSTSVRVQRGSGSDWDDTSYTDGASYQLYSFVTNNPATGVLVDEDWARCTIGEGDSLPGSGFCTMTVPNTAVGDPATDPLSENFQKQFWIRQVDSPPGTYSNPTITLGDSSLTNPTNWEIPGLSRRMVGEGVNWPAGGGQPSQTTPGIFEVPRTAQFETDRGMVSLGAMPYSIINPKIEPSCEGGVTIAMVFDMSTSITNAQRAIYRNGITGPGGILDVLAPTGSSVATFTFGTDSPASGVNPNRPQPVLIPADNASQARQQLNTYINGQLPNNTPTNYTNWDAGFRAVSDSAYFDDYDFVLFVTDGAPNRLIASPGSSTTPAAPNGNNISLAAVEAAIFSANSVKATGTSVITVAVGNGVASADANLRAVSGEQLDRDFFKGDWEELRTMIGDIARAATCQVPVEVTKVLQNADGSNERPGVGWAITMDAAAEDGVIESITPDESTLTTPVSGTVEWLIQMNEPEGDVDLAISEDQSSGEAGFSFHEGVCTIADGDPETEDITVPMVNGAAAVTGLSPGDRVSCRIVNRDIATATVVINKVTDTVTDDAFPFDSDLPATGAFTGGGALIGAGPDFTLPGGGSYTVTVPVDDSAGMTVAEAVDNADLWPDGWRPNGAPICTYAGVPAGTGLPVSTDDGFMEITTALLPNSTLTCTFSNTDAEPSWTTWKLSNPGGSNTEVPTPPITEVLPDGTIVYYLYAQNDGNRPVENAVMTDNLNVSAANGVLQHAAPVGFADGTVTPVGSAGLVATQVTLMDRSGGGDANGTTVPDDQSSIPLADRGTVEFDEGAGTLTWSIPELPVGGFLRLSFPVKVNSDAFGVELHNQLLSTGDVEPLECEQGDNATARCNTWHQTGTPEWTLTKSSDPASGSTVAPGDTITYTVTATNSTNVPVTGVEIEDDLSEVLNNAELISGPTASAGTATLPDGSTTLTWEIPVLGANATETVTYTVRVNADATGVTIGNVVTGEGIVPPEECAEDDPDCRETEHFTPAYTLVKDSDPVSGSTVVPGGTIDYTLTVTNPSDVDFEENLVIHDDLSEVLNNAELTDGPTVSPEDTSSATIRDNDLTWTIMELPAGETVTVTYQVTVNDDATGVTLKNVATGDEEVPPEPCEPDDPECRETEHHTPEWTLAKTADPASGTTVLPGSEVTYTLTATNDSDAPAEDVVVTDDLSNVLNKAILTAGPTASTGTAQLAGTTLTWTVGTLAAGATETVTYTVTINEDALGVTIGNVVTGEGSVPPEECTPEEPCETTHETPGVWSLSKTSDPATGSTVKPGDTITYTVTAVNSSEKAIEDAVVTDDLSNVLNHAALTGGPTASLGTASVTGNTLTWNIGDLPANSSHTVTYEVTVNSDALGVTIGNVVTGEGSVPPEECTPEEPCETTHETDPAWTLVKDSDPASGSTVKPGETITYTVTAENISDKPATDIVITDDLSNVLNNAGLTDGPTTATGTAEVEDTTLTWTLGTLAANSTATVTYTVTVNADATGVTIGNVVTGEGTTPPEPCEPEDPECRETEHPTPAYTLVKSSDPVSGSTVTPGSDITYTLTVNNPSDGDFEDELVITDDLSDVLNNAQMKGSPTASVGTASVSGTTLTWTIPSLGAGETVTVTYTVTVNDDATGVTLKNVATGDEEFPPEPCELEDPECNETEHFTPEWTLVKDSDPASGSTVQPGADVVYTLTATNTSDAVVKDARAIDDLSNVLNNAELVEPLAAGLDLEGDTLTWTIPTLQPGESATVSYTVTVNEDAYGVTIGNVVTGEGEVPPEPCEPEDPECRETEHPIPAWTIKKESDPVSGSTVLPGSDIVYTLTVENVSDGVVEGEIAIDDLSEVLNNAVLVESSLEGKPLTFDADAETLTWAIPTLQPGETATVTYTVTVNEDATGVWLRNAVTSPGSVPCVPEDEGGGFFGWLGGLFRADADEDELCPTTTEHVTPEWTLAKTSDPASGTTVLPGSDIVYTLTVTNTFEADAENVVVTDDLSSVLNNAALTAGPTTSLGTAELAGTTLTWSVGTLPAGATETVTYTVTVDEDALGIEIGNVATGTGSVPPEECTPEEPCETDHKTPAVWSISKTSDPATGSTVKPGDTIAYTVTATNSSDRAIEGAVVTDDLSGVLNNATLTEGPTASIGTAALADTTLTWNIGDLPAKSSQTLTYTVTVDADAYGVTIGNVVSGDGSVPPEECTPEEPCETEHGTDPIWTLAKSSDPASGSTVLPGTDVTYTVTVTNPSKSAVTDIAVVDDLSQVLNNAEIVGGPTASTGTAEVEGTALTWMIPSLGAGATETVTYTVTIDEGATGVTLKNVVTGEGEVPPEPCEPDDPECNETEHFTPEWTLVKDSDPVSGSTVNPGDSVTYTLTATNTSETDVTGAKAIDDMSKVLNSADLVGSLADGLALNGTTLTWTIPDLAPGEAATVSYTVKIKADAFGVTIGNVVTGEGAVPPEPCEPDDPECRETEHVTPGWTLEKQSDPKSGSKVKAGQVVKYTLTATNTSDSDVKGAKAVDDMSKVLDAASLQTPLAEGLALDGTALTWSIPDLKPGESASVSYSVKVRPFDSTIKLLNVVAPGTPGGECLPGKCSTTHPGGGLPVTGAQIGGIAIAALVLVGAGGAAIYGSSRRRKGAHTA